MIYIKSVKMSKARKDFRVEILLLFSIPIFSYLWIPENFNRLIDIELLFVSRKDNKYSFPPSLKEKLSVKLGIK